MAAIFAFPKGRVRAETALAGAMLEDPALRAELLTEALEQMDWGENRELACKGLADLARDFLSRENLLSASMLAGAVSPYCQEAAASYCASCPLTRLRAAPFPPAV